MPRICLASLSIRSPALRRLSGDRTPAHVLISADIPNTLVSTVASACSNPLRNESRCVAGKRPRLIFPFTAVDNIAAVFLCGVTVSQCYQLYFCTVGSWLHKGCTSVHENTDHCIIAPNEFQTCRNRSETPNVLRLSTTVGQCPMGPTPSVSVLNAHADIECRLVLDPSMLGKGFTLYRYYYSGYL